MTEIQAKIVEFDLLPHPNADLLSIAKLRDKEWQCVVKTSDMIDRKLGVYIPIDALVPVANPAFAFLTGQAKADGTFRIKTIRLRQQLSQGLLLPAPEGAQLGDDLTEALGVTRWEPVIPAHLAGDLIREPGNFQKYTSIENWKNFPNVFKEGDMVRMTEKIHGTNARFGFVDDGSVEGMRYFVGTHRTARDKDGKNLYSEMSRKLELEEKIGQFAHNRGISAHLIVFGEIYGPGVQDLTYGLKGETGLRIFDILVDHQYQPWEVVQEVADHLKVETVPLLYRGPFRLDLALAHRDGKTTIGSAHLREGIVVTADPDVFDPTVGRKMLKFISDDYLLRKGATDGH